MFIGYYELDGKEFFSIYNKCEEGYKQWFDDTFSPTCENINVLNFLIYGDTYGYKKDYLRELAKKWQYEFASLSWSYGELATIQDWFYKNGKRYGLLKEFKENAIC